MSCVISHARTCLTRTGRKRLQARMHDVTHVESSHSRHATNAADVTINVTYVVHITVADNKASISSITAAGDPVISSTIDDDDDDDDDDEDDDDDDDDDDDAPDGACPFG